jgi:hypothetical protein
LLTKHFKITRRKGKHLVPNLHSLKM